MAQHRNYSIEHDGGVGVVVIDPRWPDAPVYRADTAERARLWIDHYRRGCLWAEQAAIPMTR